MSCYKTLIKTIVMSFLFFGGAQAEQPAMTLEFRDVQNFSLIENRDNHSLSLRLSGLAFHSSLAVGRIDTISDGNAIIIKVRLVPARSGLSGRFSHTVDIPVQTRRILFGEDGYQIWPNCADHSEGTEIKKQ